MTKPSWDFREWQQAITCVAETLASWRNLDDPPPPNEQDQLEAGHIAGALLGRGFIELRGMVSVSEAAPTLPELRDKAEELTRGMKVNPDDPIEGPVEEPK